MPPSCASLGGFAIGARVALLWQYVICNEAVPFRPYCGGVVTQTRNLGEYMLVLALCIVCFTVVDQDGT